MLHDERTLIFTVNFCDHHIKLLYFTSVVWLCFQFMKTLYLNPFTMCVLACVVVRCVNSHVQPIGLKKDRHFRQTTFY